MNTERYKYDWSNGKDRVRSMDIFMEEVLSSEENILLNMFEFYDYEFSPLLDFEVNNEGLFRKAPISRYLTNGSYTAYFIKSHDTLLGFVIVKKSSCKPLFEIEQFFILKKYNGRGIGKLAAFKTFDRYRGYWKVTIIEKNYSARSFWKKVIKEYSDDSHNESYDKKHGYILEFTNI